MLESIVKNYISNTIADKLADKFGVSPQMARTLVAKAVPLFMGGMANKATKDKSAAAGLFGAITKDHDGSIFDNIEGLLADPKSAKGDKILSHVFGSNETGVEKALAKETGMEAAQTKDMMSALAPMIMGALGKEQSEKNLETEHLAKMFAAEQKEISKQKATNPLLAMLDKEGDGVADNLLSMGMSFLKKS